jgi:inner membrane protein
MSGPAHQTTTLAAALAAAAAAHASHDAALAFIGVATITSGGPLSPDVDQRLPFIRHRGITHWLPAAIILAYVTHSILTATTPDAADPVAAGLLFGWTLHILEDSLTPDGVPAWPLRDHWHLIPFRVRVISGPPRPGRPYVAINEWLVAVPTGAASLLLLPGYLT